jgi:hypothetical protein
MTSIKANINIHTYTYCMWGGGQRAGWHLLLSQGIPSNTAHIATVPDNEAPTEEWRHT